MSNDLDLNVRLPDGTIHESCRVPKDLSISEVILDLADRLGLPNTDEDGYPISHYLVIEGAALLDRSLTLFEVGVKNGDTVEVISSSISKTTPVASPDYATIAGEIVTVATAMLSAAGGMKMILEMVKLWVEERGERRIKLRSGDIELELQGTMSQREIQQKIELFSEFARAAKEKDIKIIVE